MNGETETMLNGWLDNRGDLVEFEVVPVRTSEQATRVTTPVTMMCLLRNGQPEGCSLNGFIGSRC